MAKESAASKPVYLVTPISMGLAHPVSSKVLTRSGSPQFKVGAASMQGFRNGTESLEKTILAFVDFVEGMRAPSKGTLSNFQVRHRNRHVMTRNDREEDVTMAHKLSFAGIW